MLAGPWLLGAGQTRKAKSEHKQAHAVTKLRFVSATTELIFDQILLLYSSISIACLCDEIGPQKRGSCHGKGGRPGGLHGAVLHHCAPIL
jgi:hypothetical protein